MSYPTDLDLNKSEVDGLIAPNTEAAGDAISISETPVTFDQMLEVSRGTLIWVEWGVVRYEDVFGKQHHLWFCHEWNWKSPQVITCPKGTHND